MVKWHCCGFLAVLPLSVFAFRWAGTEDHSAFQLIILKHATKQAHEISS